MTKGTISEHIKHVFDDGELVPEATVRLFRTVWQIAPHWSHRIAA
jgi:hypothetical protein